MFSPFTLATRIRNSKLKRCLHASTSTVVTKTSSPDLCVSSHHLHTTPSPTDFKRSLNFCSVPHQLRRLPGQYCTSLSWSADGSTLFSGYTDDVGIRVDFGTPISKWYSAEKEVVSEGGNNEISKLNSKVHLTLSFDGGYHILDELTHYSSDLKATSKELWKLSIGVLELGILNAQGLSPMKNRYGRGIRSLLCGEIWSEMD